MSDGKARRLRLSCGSRQHGRQAHTKCMAACCGHRAWAPGKMKPKGAMLHVKISCPRAPATMVYVPSMLPRTLKMTSHACSDLLENNDTIICAGAARARGLLDLTARARDLLDLKARARPDSAATHTQPRTRTHENSVCMQTRAQILAQIKAHENTAACTNAATRATAAATTTVTKQTTKCHES